MFYIIRMICFLVVMIVATFNNGHASEIIPSYGLTSIDINNNEKNDLLLRGKVNLSNAHDYDSYIFMLEDGTIVPFETNNKFLSSINSVEDAECTIRQIHILNDGTVRVVIAERSYLDSFSEKVFVNFTEYVLSENIEEVPGIPRIYFKKSSVKKTKHKYCDVQKAWEKEY